MKDLIISTEATCDVLLETKEKLKLEIFDMDFFIGDEAYSSKTDDTISSGLYQKMREGKKVTTSQINEAMYEEYFSNLMKQQKPILHIAFSGGLSGSCAGAMAVAKRLNENFEPNIYVVDSKGACGGQVILAELAREFEKDAKDAAEVAEKLEAVVPKIINRFSVDNLKYLANGGRISGAAALVGNLLKVKPIIKADDEGRLLSFQKVISRKKALRVMANQFVQEVDKDSKFCYISHADCEEDANIIKSYIEAETDFKPVIMNIGPVLSCHCGPGTVAMFYIGHKR